MPEGKPTLAEQGSGPVFRLDPIERRGAECVESRLHGFTASTFCFHHTPFPSSQPSKLVYLVR